MLTNTDYHYRNETRRLARIERERNEVVREARTWIGTSFHHEAQVKGSGVDCAHLVAAVYSACGVIETPTIERYDEHWCIHETTERLEQAIDAICVRVEKPVMGDLAMFRFGVATAHAAIVTDWPRIVHAERNRGVVLEDIIDERGPMERRLAGFWSPRSWHA